MTARTAGYAILIALTGGLVAGCANNGDLSTAAITAENTAAAAPKVDPMCVTLAHQIETLRQDGAVEKLEKASTGKGAQVKVKRELLAKQAELNKANADYQTRCTPQLLRSQQSAQAVPQGAAAQAAPIAAAPSSATVKTQLQQQTSDAAVKQTQ